ncbi:MAG: HAMP domain-containing protein [Firmicutes bacterium]|nr:HAMP domain-containing protein [Bacillota bacterium]
MKSLAAKISVYIVGLVLIICIGLGVFAHLNGSKAVLAEVEQALILQAMEAAEIIDRTVEKDLAVLEAVAARPEIRSMNWSIQRPALQAEQKRLGIYGALSIVQPNGMATHDTGETVDLSARDYIRETLTGKKVVSDLLVTTDTKELATVFAVPIYNNNRVVGALIARGDGRFLKNITDELTFGNKGWGYVLGQDGTLFADPDIDKVLQQRNLFTDNLLQDHGQAIKTLGMGNTGIIRFTEDNLGKISGLAPVPSTGWMVGVGVVEADVLANINRLKSSLLLAAAIFAALGVLAAALIAKQITDPLHNVQQTIEAVAEGDLTKTVRIKAKDELGLVANALNSTTESMRQALDLVTDTANKLGDTSAEMAASFEEISASIEEVASTTNQFSGTLDTTTQNAHSLSRSVQGISEKSRAGETAIAEIVGDIDALQQNTVNLANDVGELGQLSEQIGNIVTAIDEIAEQTNLLALNAAIEAARAGEHGRGFAVVADEVRRLAEQSSHATTEITALIGRIQGRIDAAVLGMQDSVAQTARVAENIDVSGKSLEDILREVEGIIAGVRQISSGLEQANTGGHEIASATEEQSAAVQEVAAQVQELTTMAAALQDLLRHFRLI